MRVQGNIMSTLLQHDASGYLTGRKFRSRAFARDAHSLAVLRATSQLSSLESKLGLPARPAAMSSHIRGDNAPSDEPVSLGMIHPSVRSRAATFRKTLSGLRNTALGTQKGREKQHKGNKLTARERLEVLLDSGSFLEYDQLAEHR
jgi:hypothetical protein